MKSLKSILLLISLFILNSPIYAIWLSVDPLSDKYPYISPYAYCENNPVKYVDPDGRRSKMIQYNNTLTVQAVYYTHPLDLKSAQQAISFWNNQKKTTIHR
jgi:hypothetical protein